MSLVLAFILSGALSVQADPQDPLAALVEGLAANRHCMGTTVGALLIRF